VQFTIARSSFICTDKNNIKCSLKLCYVQFHLSLKWISQDKNDRISTEEHLWDVSVLVDRFGFLLAFASFWHLSPHLFYVLHHHIAVPATEWSCHILIKCYYSCCAVYKKVGWQLMLVSLHTWYSCNIVTVMIITVTTITGQFNCFLVIVSVEIERIFLTLVFPANHLTSTAKAKTTNNNQIITKTQTRSKQNQTFNPTFTPFSQKTNSGLTKIYGSQSPMNDAAKHKL